MENVLIAVISAMATVVVAIIGLFGKDKLTRSRKKTTPVDEGKLIQTLKDTLVAQTERIRLLETAYNEHVVQLAAKDAEISELKERVSKLEQLTITQALEISSHQKTIVRLERRGGRQKIEGGDLHNNEND